MSPAIAAAVGLLVSAIPDGLLRLDLRAGIDSDESDQLRWRGAPRGFVQLGDTLYFAASTPGEGDELWAASAGGGDARLVVDLAPGARSSGPEPLIVLDGRLFFAADDGYGRRLFESDGTARGTRRSSLFPDAVDAGDSWWWRFRFLATAPDLLTVVFPEGAGGAAFYQSDGRSAAARLGAIPGPYAQVTSVLALPDRLLAIRASASGDSGLWSVGGGQAERLTPGGSLSYLHGVLDDRAFYSVFNSPVAGLWVTDGTAAGTRRLSAFPGEEGGAVANGRLYYLAHDGNLIWSLWRTDGTAAGTEAIRSGFEWPKMMGAFRDRVVFRSLRESSVWTSDGTSAGTQLIGRSFAAEPRIASDGDGFFFVGVRDFASSGNTSSGTEALARSDGTAAGTAFVSLPDGGRLTWPDGHLAAVASGVAVDAETPAGGTEAWLLDGADARPLAAFNPVPASSAPEWLTPLGARVIFAAADAAHGDEPWASDGTAAGTALLADLVAGADGSDPSALRVAGDVVRFLATLREPDGPARAVPHETDGTAAGTRSLAGEPRWASGLPLLDDGALWYVVPEPVGRYLGLSIWRYLDGVETRVFGPTLDGPTSGPMRVGSRVLFTIRSLYGEGGLYATTGGEPEQLLSADAWALASRGDVALFTTVDSEPRLWRTDGTREGTLSLSVNARGATLVGGLFYFAGDGGTGYEPWISDGTLEGTRALGQLAPGAASSAPSHFAAARGGVVFWADPGGGPVLFATDGTATSRISNVRPGPSPWVNDRGQGFSPLGDGLLAFAGWDPDGGLEPWVTDGTAAGTGRIADLAPGTRSSDPGRFIRAGERVFFAAHEAAIGRELHVLPAPAFAPSSAEPSIPDDAAPSTPSENPPAEPPTDGVGGQNRKGGGCSTGGDVAGLALASVGAALAGRCRRRSNAQEPANGARRSARGAPQSDS